MNAERDLRLQYLAAIGLNETQDPKYILNCCRRGGFLLVSSFIPEDIGQLHDAIRKNQPGAEAGPNAQQ